MNAIRKILMPLLIIPLGMFMYVFSHPDWQWESPGLESLFALLSIPIVIFNFMTWFYPEIIRAYFPVKEDWDQGNGKPITFAIVISTLIAFTCVGVGAASAISRVSARPTPRPFAARPTAVAAFTHSVPSLPDSANSDETDTVSIPQKLPKTDIPPEQASQTPKTDVLPEQTPQIPVSGGASISLPTLTATQTEVGSAATAPTRTASPASLCSPADPDYLDAILQSVQDADPDNEVVTAWMVQSKVAANLWFVAAKVSGPSIDAGTTPPGVWGLFVATDGNFDIYSINDTAMEFSGADWGEDSEPVLTMQSDGAQTAYDCAVHGA